MERYNIQIKADEFKIKEKNIKIVMGGLADMDNYEVNYESENGYDEKKIIYLIGSTIVKCCEEKKLDIDVFTLELELSGYKYDKEEKKISIEFSG